MRTLVLTTLISFVITISLSAQTDSSGFVRDTIFYLSEHGFIQEVTRSRAEGFSFKVPANTSQYIRNIFFLQSETPMAEYECYDKILSNSRRGAKSSYTIKNGKYQEWHISGEKKTECFYSEGQLNGEFIVYHKNGKVKRQEIWQMGEWQRGKCFDEDGNETQYCSYQEEAEFKGGLSAMYKFLKKELKYPYSSNLKGIQGKVYISFVVETDGSLTELEILHGVDKAIDEEAIRVVKAMPKWKPGKFEGKLVRYTFIMPISFTLR